MLFLSLPFLPSLLILTSPLQHVFLMDNPWNCDCHLKQFRWDNHISLLDWLLSSQRLHHQEEPLPLRRLLLRAGAVGGQDLGPAGLHRVRLQADEQVRERPGQRQGRHQPQSGVLSGGQPWPGRQVGQVGQDPRQPVHPGSVQPPWAEIHHLTQLRHSREALILHWDHSYFNIILLENFFFQNIILIVRQLPGPRWHCQDKQQSDNPERDSPRSGQLFLCGNQQGRHVGVPDQSRSGPGQLTLKPLSQMKWLKVSGELLVRDNRGDHHHLDNTGGGHCFRLQSPHHEDTGHKVKPVKPGEILS